MDGEGQDKSINDVIQDMAHVEITISPYGENVTSKAFDTISRIFDNSN
jgi:hypothetical protein